MATCSVGGRQGSAQTTSSTAISPISPFYFTESLSVLRCYIPLLRAKEDADDPLHDVAAQFLDKVPPSLPRFPRLDCASSSASLVIPSLPLHRRPFASKSPTFNTRTHTQNTSAFPAYSSTSRSRTSGFCILLHYYASKRNATKHMYILFSLAW
ncbi:hypothetical protein EXIGLDRAFT_364554 [Exidia glandulosa HHB12029]|uniref:Uncharacterized protein n=1 Tax=Exidia glandulosa HHB12029 TaxID=1314781 RepID=A0A165ZDW7_EXIGL|nr:hypothetical protein EXIGLDRAFT_364554 [Exidia glandulosa HHB12029]